MDKNEINSFHDFGLPHQEGQLLVDVIETDDSIFIRTAIAGVRSQAIDLHVTSDTVTIRGKRDLPQIQTNTRMEEIIHVQECHWGEFSRSIILPHQILPEKAEAVLQNGILLITLPKISTEDSQIRVFELES